MSAPRSVALIGFGEVGQIFARELRALGVGRIAAFDIAFGDATSPAARGLADAPVVACESTAAAARGAELVISAVTAAQTLAAARAIAGGVEPGAFVLDINSVSPGAKQTAQAEVERAGGRYVEAAVMSAVPPHGLKAPMLLGGPHARDFLAFAAPLGLRAEPFADTVGPASAVKMSRSVIVKGLEAVVTECLLTARHYGVERAVLDSLADTMKLPDWDGFARYLISRSLAHGKRRAEEMREAARTVAEAGIPPLMTERTVTRQDRTYALGRAHGIAPKSALPDLLDAMLAAGREEGAGAAFDETVPGSAA